LTLIGKNSEGFSIKEDIEKKIETFEDFTALLKFGKANRATASTEKNKSSSRSHTVFRISLKYSLNNQ
jgi:hypothetical protein